MPKKQISVSNVIVSHDHDAHAHTFLFFWAFVQATLLAVGFVFVTLLIAGALLSYRYVHTVSLHAGVGIKSLLETGKVGWQTSVPTTNGRENILILGVDTLGNRDSSAINTDTIMVASLGLKDGVATTFSIPRDLYLMDEKAKINSLYGLALKDKNPRPQERTARAVQKLTGLTIHHTVVLEMNELGKLIDALGGIDVTIDRTFTDERFPREDVDVTTEHDPAKLYKTASFQAGVQHLDGQRALEFIRSRHSSDPQEGTDDARSLRQQHVIAAFITRLSDRSIPRNPAYVGDLLHLYKQDFSQYIPLEEVIALGKTFLQTKHLPTLRSQHFAIDGVEKNPVLYHPTRFVNGQWVYLLSDPSGTQMKALIEEWLK